MARQGPNTPPSAAGAPCFGALCPLPTCCLALWPLYPGSAHLGLDPSTAVSPHAKEWAVPSMAGVGKLSPVHRHQADSRPCWHLDPALTSQLSPVVFTQRWGPNCSKASCPARAVQRPASPDPSHALSVGQREAVFTFSHHWRWFGSRQLALWSPPQEAGVWDSIQVLAGFA